MALLILRKKIMNLQANPPNVGGCYVFATFQHNTNRINLYNNCIKYCRPYRIKVSTFIQMQHSHHLFNIRREKSYILETRHFFYLCELRVQAIPTFAGNQIPHSKNKIKWIFFLGNKLLRISFKKSTSILGNTLQNV